MPFTELKKNYLNRDATLNISLIKERNCPVNKFIYKLEQI